jgi:UDP-GlcNAc:undecaprenyl-phosphate/decaprenyl-phosphate GlcNAc-1-phosphate transferase
MTTILAIFAISFALSLVLTPVARWVGMRLGAMDVPNERKTHAQPTPRTGGVAIFVSFVLALGASKLWDSSVSEMVVLNQKSLFLFLGASIVFGIGVTDDFHRLRPWVKFLFQVVAASVTFFGGVKIVGIGVLTASPLSWATSYVFTVFWFVLVINAINLVDGLNGLAGGIGVFACVMIVILSVLRTDYLTALFFAALGGATLGFLRYNFNPASIFLGDGGSYFLGYAIAGLSILGGTKTQTGAVLMIPVLALGVPLFDTLLAPVRRFIRGQKMFSPDHGHIHHRLREMGLSTKNVVWVLYAVSFALCVLALILVNLRDEQAGLFLIILGVGVIIVVRKLGYFEYFAFDKVYGWLRDLTDETGLSHERRSFLNVQMDIGASRDMEGLWGNMVRGVGMLGFDVAEMVLKGPDVGGRRSEDRGRRTDVRGRISDIGHPVT